MTHFQSKGESEVCTQLRFKGLGYALPFPGYLSDWDQFVARARTSAGSQGMEAMRLTWACFERDYYVDLNHTTVLSAVTDKPKATSEAA